MFDHDMLSKDDKMGDAEIDLQPMISAATAFGDPDLLADMQIGKWLKSRTMRWQGTAPSMSSVARSSRRSL